MNVVTRFAPSPTGYLHIGGARTALFNWLFAKKNNGEFIIRIEDTDSYRSSKKHSEALMDILEWLDLKPYESPIKIMIITPKAPNGSKNGLDQESAIKPQSKCQSRAYFAHVFEPQEFFQIHLRKKRL